MFNIMNGTSKYSPKKQFDPNVEPFEPSKRCKNSRMETSRDLINVGPSQVPVNAKIWKTIASNRVFPEMPEISQAHSNQFLMPAVSYSVPVSFNEIIESSEYINDSSTFEVDRNRDVILFRRDFGPVATAEGVELRLKYGVKVLISLEGAVRLESGDVRIAVAANSGSSAIQHPNGSIYQKSDRVDVVAFDGMRQNNLLRYAKIWKNCISLTALGCALVYLVDTAGTRTTSDQVNRDWSRDYCNEAYVDGMTNRSQLETHNAAEHYYYKIEEDGSHSFIICNVRVSQAQDGMIRIYSESFSIRANLQNLAVTLKTPFIHCTASMGSSPHLFIRMNERRVHFDGTNFVVRNMGHSSSFNGENHLRIH